MDTQLKDIINNVYTTNWDLINAFEVQFTGNGINNIIKKNNNTISNLNKNIQMAIIDINTPQFNSQNIESYLGGQWFINNGRDEVYRFSMTFRDFNQMSLYRFFLKLYAQQRQQYFNEASFKVIINKAQGLNSFTGNTTLDASSKKLFEFDETLIDSISQLSLSNNTEAQIAEFSVEFKSAKPLWAKNISIN